METKGYRVKISLWTECDYHGNKSVYYFVKSKRTKEFAPKCAGVDSAKIWKHKSYADYIAFKIRDYLNGQLFIGSYCVDVEEV